MTGLTVEILDEQQVGAPCEACGAPTSVARGLVYSNGDADSVYFSSWSECSPGLVKLAVAVGEWGDDADPATRPAVLVDAMAEPSRIRFAVTGSKASPWRDLELARPLDRGAALEDPLIEHVYAVLDVVVRHDPRIREQLEDA